MNNSYEISLVSYKTKNKKTKNEYCCFLDRAPGKSPMSRLLSL